MPNLDRFSHGLPDRQQEEALDECQLCGYQLFQNYDAYMFEDGSYACSEDCALKLAGATIVIVDK